MSAHKTFQQIEEAARDCMCRVLPNKCVEKKCFTGLLADQGYLFFGACVVEGSLTDAMED